MNFKLHPLDDTGFLQEKMKDMFRYIVIWFLEMRTGIFFLIVIECLILFSGFLKGLAKGNAHSSWSLVWSDCDF